MSKSIDWKALGAPFATDELEFLPRAQSNGKALALAYIDARAVMNRLDAVVGPDGWTFDFDVLSPDGKMVRGKLTIAGVTKCDAGEASSEDEILKSAVSDALKRCAVHFGIGRYLYYLPKVWAAYDAQRRRFTEQPRIDRAAVETALRQCGQDPNQAPAQAPAQQAPVRTQPARESLERAPSYSGVTGAQPLPEITDKRGNPLPVQPASSLLPPEAAPALKCSTKACGKVLTQGQHASSVRAFGEPLCPACQKSAARNARSGEGHRATTHPN